MQLDGIPWRFPDPEAALLDWRGRLRHLLQHLDGEAEQLKAELKEPGLAPLTEKRLRKLLQAKVEHRKALTELLQPLEIPETGSVELSRALRARMPVGQSITSYYPNLHRDWAWGDEENAASLACVEEALAGRKPRRVAVLGAGACRLAYDVHQKLGPERTEALDINPLLLLVAKRVTAGRNVKLYEFPIAPRDMASVAVQRTLSAPEKAREGFSLVFGDAYAPPFDPGSFDVVLTPWLIDILPERLERLLPAINRLLEPGGVWVSFGSLAFQHPAQAHNLTWEETEALVADRGFSVGAPIFREMPYMRSPASNHARVERTTTFAAVKTAERADEVARPSLPDWLLDPTRPIPRTKAHDSFQITHTIYVDVVGAIDGRRSIAEIARAFATKYKMQDAEATHAVRTFLLKHYEESRL